MRGGRENPLSASPTMIGAITVLIAILAVFLAYNANNGLPFVPSYNVSVRVPNADQLVPGNEVRIGGVRVGQIQAIEPVQDAEGKLSAEMDLKLNQEVEPLPRDTELTVRAKSALGLKYLELRKGTSEEGYPPGAIIPLSQAKPEPVDIDQVLNVFDAETRRASQQSLLEFGNALAGRGPQVNAALGELEPALPPLERVMRDLGKPETGLGRFVRALSDTAAEAGPVAEQQARMFVSLDTTFAALASVARPYIQETISESVPTLDVGIRKLPRLRPFLRHSTTLLAELRPGVDALRANAPTIASALETGIPVLRASPSFNRKLPGVSEALRDFANDPGVTAGIERLTETSDILTPTVRFLAPAQTVCNYGSVALRNLSSVLAEGDGLGTWQRFIIFVPPPGDNNEGSPSSGPANGAGGDPRNFLHYNPYPNTAAPGQERECEAGNEGYQVGQQMIGNVPGNQGTTHDVTTRDTSK
jgi:phospholipid/cholesterol/gamma-HCH transport system substrate-binding protein